MQTSRPHFALNCASKFGIEKLRAVVRWYPRKPEGLTVWNDVLEPFVSSLDYTGQLPKRAEREATNINCKIVLRPKSKDFVQKCSAWLMPIIARPLSSLTLTCLNDPCIEFVWGATWFANTPQKRKIPHDIHQGPNNHTTNLKEAKSSGYMGAKKYVKKNHLFWELHLLVTCASWEENMSERIALPETFRSNGPSEKFVSICSEKLNETQRTFTQKSIGERANFPHESLPVVVLDTFPLKIGAFFQRHSSVCSGRVPKVKVVLQESDHVDCMSSGAVCSWSSPVNALSVKVRRG